MCVYVVVVIVNVVVNVVLVGVVVDDGVSVVVEWLCGNLEFRRGATLFFCTAVFIKWA